MKSRLRPFAAALAIGYCLFAAAVGLEASQSARPRRVVIVSMPSVVWEDVSAGYAPNLAALAEEWSIAAMSVRTVGPRTDLASAYATINAGNRARGFGKQNNQYIPVTVPARSGGLIVERMRDVVADNAGELHYGAVPGTLGDALHRKGFRTAAIGNLDGYALLVDPGSSPNPPRRLLEVRRFAGLVLADRLGRVDAGDTGNDLLVADPALPSGYRNDPDAIMTALSGVPDDPGAVLVELGDTLREGRALFYEGGNQTDSSAMTNPARVAAIKRDDALLARVLAHLDLNRDAAVVLGTAGPGPAVRERLMVAVLAGRGAARGGWLTSPTTKRDGLVTIADVGPGVLRLLGIDPPVQMTGRAAVATGSGDIGRLQRLVRLDSAALFHLRWLTPFFAALVLTQLVLYLSAWRPATAAGSKANFAMRAATLLFLSVPGSTFIWHALGPQALDLWALPLLVAISLALAAISLAGPWKTNPSGPPAFISAVTFAVIAADLVAGANLQMSTLIGYSPIVAGRFYGIGNLDFAIFGTAAILTASSFALFLRRGKVAAVAVMGAATTILVGAPNFGADFGGLISLVIGFGVLILSISGRRVSWRRVTLLAVAALAVALGAGYLDSLRAPQVQTHMGRFVSSLIERGPSAVAEVITRKALANWSVATSSLLSLSVPIAGVFLYLLLRNPRGRLRGAFDTVPGLRAGLIAAGALNIAGFAVNDSGIAVPAMGLAVGVPYCLATILATRVGAPDSAT